MLRRLYNAKIMPLTRLKGPEDPGWYEGELWIRDDVIVYAGPANGEGIPQEEPDWSLDLEGDLVLPGFKNAHTHSAMTFLRSYADDLPLQEWLETQVFPLEDKLQEDDVYWLSLLAIMEYLTSGITANFDMYMFPEAAMRASRRAGFRTVLCGAINDFGGSIEEEEQRYLRYNHDCGPLISYTFGCHAEYTTSRERLEGLAELVHRYEAPFFTHNSETKAEVQGCLERHGVTPTVFFTELGLYDHGGGGFHCLYLSEEDRAIFSKRGLHLVSNPGSNAKLASGIAPLAQYWDDGISLSLGTDGPASNNALDFFREMYLATVLQKILLEDASAMPADRVLWMATVGGARAMGLRDCETLEKGQQADLQVLSLREPNFQPENHLMKNLVYSGSKKNVRLTMVAGQVLYQDGAYAIGEEAEEVYERAGAVLRRMEGK